MSYAVWKDLNSVTKIQVYMDIFRASYFVTKCHFVVIEKMKTTISDKLKKNIFLFLECSNRVEHKNT